MKRFNKLFFAAILFATSILQIPLKTSYANEESKTITNKIIDCKLYDNGGAALYSNGDLYAWGNNSKRGIVGDGSSSVVSTPKMIMKDVVQFDNCVAVKGNGDLYFWGENYENKKTLKPVKILSNIKSVSANGGSGYTAISNKGELFSWGRLSTGYISYNSGKINLPTKPVMTDVKCAYKGGCVVAAIKTDGSLYTWGYDEGYGGCNKCGELGTGDYKIHDTPQKIIDSGVESVSINSFDNRTCVSALMENGDLLCWGYNLQGQLGLSHNDNVAKPTNVFSNIQSYSISAFDNYKACAVTKDGKINVWSDDNIVPSLGNEFLDISQKLDITEYKIKETKCGNGYFSLLTDDGHLFIYDGGYPRRNENEDNYIQDKVEKYTVNKMGTAFAIISDGNLYTCGYNKNYSLGIGEDTSKIKYPQLILEKKTSETSQAPEPDEEVGLLMSKWIQVPFERKLMIKWDWNDLKGDSTTVGENKNLAIAGLVLSNAAESDKDTPEQCENTMRDIGFEKIYSNYYPNGTKDKNSLDYPSMSFGYKKIEIDGDDKHIICAVYRGTRFGIDLVTDLQATVDGFECAGINGKNELIKYINMIQEENNVSLDKTNSIFFITGHSLGAATASVVTEQTYEFANPKKVFTYVYATPNYAAEGNDKDSFTNVHNYINKDDEVTNMPALFSKVGESRQCKYSTLKDNSPTNYNRFCRVYKYLRGKKYEDDKNPIGIDIPLLDWRDHLPFTYMSFIMSSFTDSEIDHYIAPFEIKGSSMSIKKCKAGKNKITVEASKYKKCQSPIYEFRIKKSGSWKYYKTSKTTQTMNGLKKGKKYTVQVRIRKTLDGVTYTSKWSKSVSLKSK